MKPFTDHFSFARKTISLLLLVAFAFSNVVAVATATTSTETAITTFTTDLTQLGREGRLRRTPSFEAEVNKVIEVLAKGGSRQPVIVDENGSVQDEIVEQIAIRIAKGSVTDALRNRSLIKLETTKLFSSALGSARVNDAVAQILETALASKGQTTLFIDDLATFVNSATANSAFVGAIRDGKLTVIGGSSKAAFDEKIAANSSIASLFEVISVDRAESDKSAQVDGPRAKRSYRGDNVSPDLREMMNEDASGKKRVDVIVQAKDADNPSLRALFESGEATITDRIGRSDTLVVNMSLTTVRDLSNSGLINYISPDRQVAMQGHVETTTGTSQMRSQPTGFGRTAHTLDGSGVGIAVLDSGVVSTLRSFTEGTSSSRVVYSKSFLPNDVSTSDPFGHGTHVASIAAGSSSRNYGAYRGIAPKANIVNLRVLDQNGVGTTSSLLQAIEWVRVNYRTYNLRVVNISLGTPAIDSMWNDPLCYAVQDLSYYGILVVAAAGNNGKTTNGQKVYGQVHSPGNDPSVLTVGASNSFGTDSRSDDAMTTFSSNGPTRSYYTDSAGHRHYDHVIKPDIVAPG
ncbi:MAG TPA: S8 family serine peptidase, partial [Pyrinomonadaceae bacterium]|nr:S8 family serine peptidase [Pyrinomonadaceae bacterium]